MNLNKTIKSKYILLTFLRIRFFLILVFLIILLKKFSSHYHYYITKIMCKKLVYSYFFNFRGKYEIINNIFENFLIIIDGKFNLLFNSFLLTVGFIASIFIIKSIIYYLFKKRGYKRKKVTLYIIGIWSFIYFLIIMKFSLTITILIVFIVLLLYIFDFILFDKFKPIDPKSKKLHKNLLILGVGFSEVFFTPFYIKFINSLSYHKLSKKSYFLIRNIHFTLLIFCIIILLNPFNSPYVNHTTQLIRGLTYGIDISQKSSKLFIYQNGKIISISLDNYNGSYELVCDEVISEIIEVNDNREELYIMNLSLSIININDYSIKGNIKSDLFYPDDFRVDSSDNFLFVIDDDSKFVYKIDLSMQKIIVEKEMINTFNSGFVYNKNMDVLYATEWKKHDNILPYFIYEIDGQTLNLLRKIPVPGPSWDIVVSEDGTKLFCAFPFESLFHSYVYVFDTKSFGIIDKIDVPLGTRTIALDEERQLLFAGSPATGLIELIDLRNKKVVKTYKGGDYSMREMILDKKRRNFYVSTQHFGVFKGNY